MNFLKNIFIVLFLVKVNFSFSQSLKEKTINRFHFKEYKLYKQEDTIRFLLHKKEKSTPKNLVFYLQGTSPIPQSFFGIKKTKKGYNYMQYFPSDYELLDENYAFVIIGLPGVPLVEHTKKMNIKKYHTLNSLNYRVFLANEVINYLTKNNSNLEKIIVYGHSEGAPVAAKLATVNNKITHLGFWGGNALPDFYDFILFESRNMQANKTSLKRSNDTIMKIISSFKNIASDSTNTIPSNKNEISEYTNKRWWSYAEPPINNLIKLNIPIYVQAATNDESVAIESNYLIPLEFIRLGKNNLTFNICIGCDHGFNKTIKNKKIDKWSGIFLNFIQWTKQTQ
ncbi:alpha/beta hydrolase [Tenacibaculum sp. 47A_GOM-205m]|uniref:alpha/beta hydrolase n=1 Tax=Tenacibaculum sp. 47A_GOM-205m TaxID=1380384 RepID=UPI0004B61DB0|nr:alpha/beta hydrolase [Tenacibaculum sp. 47A_GOM-205m]